MVIYNAQSDRNHPATSPNTAPAMQKECHDWSFSRMKRHLQCAERQESPCNLTKYCACHAKGVSWLILLSYETSFTMRGATGITLQPHQILRLPRKIAVPHRSEIYWKRLKWHFQCATDPTMIRPWKRKPQPAAPPRLLFALAKSRFYWKLQRFPVRLSFHISQNAAPATKSDTWTSPNAAPATKSDTWTSPNAAPATKSDTWTSPNAAPATKSDTWTSPNAAPATKSETWTSPNAAPATKSDTWTSPNAAPATKSDTWTSPNAAPATKSENYYYYYCYYYYYYYYYYDYYDYYDDDYYDYYDYYRLLRRLLLLLRLQLLRRLLLLLRLRLRLLLLLLQRLLQLRLQLLLLLLLLRLLFLSGYPKVRISEVCH